ncbi:MAG: hypothetical protein H7X86_11650 [Gorillibacterium sp.]|nr:hypothetical protein [Gorillibacterium sp.]
MTHLVVRPIFEVTYVHPEPVITQGTPGTEDNIYGFEGGLSFMHNEEFHIFTTEMSGVPVWGKTRLAHWKSLDGLHWDRISTVFESSGNFDGTDTHACLWSPMPIYDHGKEQWLITYVCYRSKPNTPEAWYRNYDGRIAMAVSQVKGPDGLAGPYEEVAILMEPGVEAAPWEGLMGVDSFYPYLTDQGWLAWYGSSIEINGLASAPDISGPWSRLSMEASVSSHTENPIVTRLEDGTYVAFFDGCGALQMIGYMISINGVDWSEPIVLDLNNHPIKWWNLTRTPLGLIPKGNGTYRLYFSAYNYNFYLTPDVWSAASDNVFDHYFASIGFLELKLK